MAQYVDGYVIPIPKRNLKIYKKMAKIGKETWMRHGALSYYECIGDDYVKHGIGFKKMCKLKPSETVIFAFIVYKSKSHRNQVMKKVMKEMHQMEFKFEMPFDMNKYSTAGFKVIEFANKK